MSSRPDPDDEKAISQMCKSHDSPAPASGFRAASMRWPNSRASASARSYMSRAAFTRVSRASGELARTRGSTSARLGGRLDRAQPGALRDVPAVISWRQSHYLDERALEPFRDARLVYLMLPS